MSTVPKHIKLIPGTVLITRYVPASDLSCWHLFYCESVANGQKVRNKWGLPTWQRLLEHFSFLISREVAADLDVILVPVVFFAHPKPRTEPGESVYCTRNVDLGPW